jgi:hypothetical protein
MSANKVLHIVRILTSKRDLEKNLLRLPRSILEFPMQPDIGKKERSILVLHFI